MPTHVPHQVVESRLLQAARLPEALYGVVGLVWFSLVNRARDPPAGEVAAAIYSAGLEGSSLTPPSLTAPWTGPTTRYTHGAPDISEETSAVFLRHTMAEKVVFAADLDEWANMALSGFVDDYDTALSKPPTGMTPAALPAASLTASSAPNSPSSVSCVSQSVPAVELSPLILRVLLWWAGRPQLPSRRSGQVAKAPRQSTNSSRINCRGVGGEPTSELSADSSDNLHPLSSEGGSSGNLPSQGQEDAMGPQQLRLRIADIFALLCHRDGGVVVSDALLYGRCHDASEFAAQRCHLVFSDFSDACWRVATTLAPTSLTPSTTAVGLVSIESSASPDSQHSSAGARSDTYDVKQVLCALVDLHTSAAQLSPLRRSPHLTTDTTVESDTVATGVLLRALLRCPPLHKRVMRLFSGDTRTTKPRRCKRGGLATVVTPPPVASAESTQGLDPPLSSTAMWSATGARRQLHIFLPVLTHASPIVSAESWKTLTVLLLPSSATTARSATHRPLLFAPACPVQRLLAAALALPGDDNDSTSVSGSPRPQPVLQPFSHPMARNNALRLLHVLCASTDLPPAVQSLFHQCPALLWRVLRLAAAVCNGIAVAHVALVRRVLADYIMFSAQQPSYGKSGGVDLRSSSSISTQALLRENKDALTCFLASTYAAWGGSGVAPENAGGDLVVAAAPVTSERGYDEKHLITVLHAL
ncbi:hypothetical_protein [Leishmania braziliensis MHOM/BR/75/M2904]|nr:hypothetical_protein [Leishmania braziliensis MHOM/BR/75/M2904]